MQAGHAHGQMISPVQNFILSHFVNCEVRIYCGHKGEGYHGKVLACADGIVTVEVNGKQVHVACDKIESIQEG